MAEFLSEEWLVALDGAARERSDALAALAPLVIEQVVEDVPGRGEVRYHLAVAPDGVHVTPGPAVRVDVRFRTGYTTAVDIARGRTNAQNALATGRLRLGGDLDGLGARGGALAAVHDVFAALRESTTFSAEQSSPPEHVG